MEVVKVRLITSRMSAIWLEEGGVCGFAYAVEPCKGHFLCVRMQGSCGNGLVGWLVCMVCLHTHVRLRERDDNRIINHI